jgi:mannose-6-phosphate isomerase-like protein (cupin superfamily)
MPKDPKNSTSPPKHEPVFFPGIHSLSAKEIPNFREVKHTGLFSQVVYMNIPVGGDIGEEVHLVDQALSFTKGKALAIIGGIPGQGGKDGKGEGKGGGEKRVECKAGDMIVVPAGTRHQFWNVGDEPLVRIL